MWFLQHVCPYTSIPAINHSKPHTTSETQRATKRKGERRGKRGERRKREEQRAREGKEARTTTRFRGKQELERFSGVSLRVVASLTATTRGPQRTLKKVQQSSSQFLCISLCFLSKQQALFSSIVSLTLLAYTHHKAYLVSEPLPFFFKPHLAPQSLFPSLLFHLIIRLIKGNENRGSFLFLRFPSIFLFFSPTLSLLSTPSPQSATPVPLIETKPLRC